MAKIRMHKEHGMGRKKARCEMDGIADDLRGRYGVEAHWDGDVLHFKRTGASGRIAVSDADIAVEMELGILLRPFQDRIKREIQAHLDRITA